MADVKPLAQLPGGDGDVIVDASEQSDLLQSGGELLVDVPPSSFPVATRLLNDSIPGALFNSFMKEGGTV